MDIVVCRGLVRKFGSQIVLDGVDFTVAAGTIVGLIGPSGCGKTTLVRALLGVVRPDAGEISVLGAAPKDFRPEQRARIGYLPQLPALFPNLSIRHNLRFAASAYGVRRRGRRRRMAELLDFVGLSDHATKLAGRASGGMQRRLGLAQALVADPELVVLDEPTAGVDPLLRERFWSYFQTQRDRGRTLIVSTQYVGEAAGCDVVAVMNAGRIVAIEAPEVLRRWASDVGSVSAEHGRPDYDEVFSAIMRAAGAVRA
jgi:ABC-2 type transport system ATP-binding protein